MSVAGSRDADLSVPSPIDRALTTLENELTVVFGRPDAVAAACAQLRTDPGLWTRSDWRDARERLFQLASQRTGPTVSPLVELLRDAASISPDPWPLIEALLASRDAGTVAAALGDLQRLSQSDALTVTPDIARRLGEIAESNNEVFGQPEMLVTCRDVLHGLVRERPDTSAPHLLPLLVDGPFPLRHLVAEILDTTTGLPSTATAAAVLGTDAADALGHYLSFTRASHRDLVDVAGGHPAALLASLAEAESLCGRALTARVIGDLGWRRVNLGLKARRVAGVSVNDSLPLLLDPAEATLLERCRGTRRQFEQVQIVAHGGTKSEPGARTPGSDSVSTIGRFRAYNLAHAELLADLLEIGPLDAAKVRGMLERMDRVVADFRELFRSRGDECAAVDAVYASLKDRILEAFAAAPPEGPLPAELTRLTQMFEDPVSASDVHTLHGLKRFLHQRGLALAFGFLEAPDATTRTVDLVFASDTHVERVQRIDYVDFEPDESAGRTAPDVPYPVAIVLDAFARQALVADQALPSVRVFCYGNEVHYYANFRNHPAFIRVDFSPPLSGGMIDLQYYGVSKYELSDHPRPALDGIRAFFERLDFTVECDTTRIHARYDKERALTLADLCASAEALFRLVPYLMDVDWIIGGLALDEHARHTVDAAWADFFARWGALPVKRLLTGDRQGILVRRELTPAGVQEVRWNGAAPYEDSLTGRPDVTLLAELDAALEASLLDVVPLALRHDDCAQLALERQVLRPLRAALSRGELVETASGFERADPQRFRRQHEAEWFAAALSSDATLVSRSAQVARVVTGLERALRFETTGSVNGYEVQRAELPLRGETFTIFALRDEGGMLRLAVYAVGDALVERRGGPALPWTSNASCDVASLVARLRRNNFLPSWVSLAGDVAEDAEAIRADFARPNPNARSQPFPGERLLVGLKAAPGRASGRVRLGTRGRRPADVEDCILVTPTTRPEDSAFLYKALGVVCTGGGILSHAGLLAIQFGRPALIVSGSWRLERAGEAALAYRWLEYRQALGTVGDLTVMERQDIREYVDYLRDDDLVVLDADAGTLQVLGQEPTALALHENLHQLTRASRRLAQAASDEAVLEQRGQRLRAWHTLERLLARMTEPVLIRHAVSELLLRALPPESGGAGQTAHLLRALVNSPTAGPLGRQLVDDVARDVAQRATAAGADALRLIPSSQDATEVLALRLAARRCYLLDEAVRRAAGPADQVTRPGPAPGLPAIDEAATMCLTWLRRGVAEAMTRAHRAGDTRGLRHVLDEAARLDAVLGGHGKAAREVGALSERLATEDQARVRALSDRWVLGPEHGGLELHPLVGWKAANLAEIGQLGERAWVPGWFAVTDRAFRSVLDGPVPSGVETIVDREVAGPTLGHVIDALVARDDVPDAQKSAWIRQLWAEVRLPDELHAELSRAYDTLAAEAAARSGPTAAGVAEDPARPFVAVRSSAHEEDTETAARAGEFDTFLFVRGIEDLVEHLKRAWSGLWTERAIHNRAALGLGGRARGGGVLVQRMVWSRVSGVLQTVNAVDRRARELVINVGLGLGEGIVSGLVGADHIVVSKEAATSDGALRFRYVTNDKFERVVFDARSGHGTARVQTLAHQRLRPALEYVELAELVRSALRLEAAYRYALDLEFAFEGPRLCLLQVRPVPGWLSAWRETTDRHPLSQGATVGAAP